MATRWREQQKTPLPSKRAQPIKKSKNDIEASSKDFLA